MYCALCSTADTGPRTDGGKSSTTGRGPTVKTNSQKAKKGLPHGELQRIVKSQGI